MYKAANTTAEEAGGTTASTGAT